MAQANTQAMAVAEPTVDRAIEFVENDGGRADAGYRGHTGDCAVRAIAIASDRPYQDVYDELAVLMKRKTRKPSARNGTPERVWGPYLKSQGWKRVDTFVPGKPKMKMRAEDMPEGISIICHMRGHLAAVVDRVLHDTWDCSDGGDRRVLSYWIKR